MFGVKSFGNSVRSRLTLGSEIDQVGSFIFSREYEKSGRMSWRLKLYLLWSVYIRMANGSGRLLFAYRVSCSTESRSKGGFDGRLLTLY